MSIKVGDRVIVVKPRPCCGYSGTLGLIFSVLELFRDTVYCGHCGAIATDNLAKLGSGFGENAQVWRLQKLPDIDEQETIETMSEVPA